MLGRKDEFGSKEEEGPAKPVRMKGGHTKGSGQDMDEEMGGDVDGRSTVEGEGRREHEKAWRMREREAGREEEDMMGKKRRTKAE